MIIVVLLNLDYFEFLINLIVDNVRTLVFYAPDLPFYYSN